MDIFAESGILSMTKIACREKIFELPSPPPLLKCDVDNKAMNEKKKVHKPNLFRHATREGKSKSQMIYYLFIEITISANENV